MANSDSDTDDSLPRPRASLSYYSETENAILRSVLRKNRLDAVKKYGQKGRPIQELEKSSVADESFIPRPRASLGYDSETENAILRSVLRKNRSDAVKKYGQKAHPLQREKSDDDNSLSKSHSLSKKRRKKRMRVSMPRPSHPVKKSLKKVRSLEVESEKSSVRDESSSIPLSRASLGYDNETVNAVSKSAIRKNSSDAIKKSLKKGFSPQVELEDSEDFVAAVSPIPVPRTRSDAVPKALKKGRSLQSEKRKSVDDDSPFESHSRSSNVVAKKRRKKQMRVSMPSRPSRPVQKRIRFLKDHIDSVVSSPEPEAFENSPIVAPKLRRSRPNRTASQQERSIINNGSTAKDIYSVTLVNLLGNGSQSQIATSNTSTSYATCSGATSTLEPAHALSSVASCSSTTSNANNSCRDLSPLADAEVSILLETHDVACDTPKPKGTKRSVNSSKQINKSKKRKDHVFLNSNLVSKNFLREMVKRHVERKLTDAEFQLLYKNINDYIEKSFDRLCDETQLYYGVFTFQSMLEALTSDSLVPKNTTSNDLMKSMRKTFGKEGYKKCEGVLYPSKYSNDCDTLRNFATG